VPLWPCNASSWLNTPELMAELSKCAKYTLQAQGFTQTGHGQHRCSLRPLSLMVLFKSSTAQCSCGPTSRAHIRNIFVKQIVTS
jgi:hypothetical protein